MEEQLKKALQEIESLKRQLAQSAKKEQISLTFDGVASPNMAEFEHKFKTKRPATLKYKKSEGDIYLLNTESHELVKANTKTDILKNLKYKTPYDMSINGLNILKHWGVSILNNKKRIISQDKTIFKKSVVVMKSLNELYKNKSTVKIMYYINMKIRWSARDEERNIMRMYEGPIMTEDEADEWADKYVSEYLAGDDVEYSYQVVPIPMANNDAKFTYKPDGKMKAIKPYTINQLYNGEIVDIKPIENCVRDYMRETYKNSKKYQKIYDAIDTLGNKDGVSPKELTEFCKIHNIKCIIYDIQGNIIASNYPSKISVHKSIIGIYYNSHFTPINNSYLNKPTKPTEEINKTRHQICENFNELLKNKEVPSNIGYYLGEDGIEITRYEYNGNLYFGNDNYEECKNILSVFGIQDKIYNSINYSNISDKFDFLFKDGDASSFFPIKTNITAYNWSNPMFDTEEKINKVYKKLKAIDANKLYSHILRTLRRLPCVDYRQAKINYNITRDTIQDDYIYLCKPSHAHILMPITDYYDGLYLKQIMKHYNDFEIEHEMEIQMKNNHYTDIINTLYAKINDPQTVKDIVNRMIGNMNLSASKITTRDIIKVCDRQEMEESGEDGKYICYNDDVFFQIEEKETVHSVKNKRLIRAMVIRYANKYVFDKMESMKLKTEQIIKIKTDEITFIDNGEYAKIQKTFSKDIGGWKDTTECIKPAINYIYKEQYTPYINKMMFDPINSSKNILNNCYAGAGKTYEIMNKLIPEIQENAESFIVLCPSHATLKEYKQADLNCSVIQAYTLINTIPEEQHIIIDEIGLCDDAAHDLIYKCSMLSKHIYAYGDFKQLLPVNEKRHYNSPSYIKYMFGTVIENSNNYRNNFTKQYYDSLINEQVDIKEELKKHFNVSKDYTKADVILCHSNSQCLEYNKLMLAYHKLDKFDVGAKIICITNTCKTLRGLGIYNKFAYTIVKYDYNTVYLDDTDSTGKQICFNKSLLKSNFESNYAMNFYNAQGQQFKNIYVPDSSINNPHMSGRMAYTIISRLKENINKDFIINFND
jgi:hypothetical protein